MPWTMAQVKAAMATYPAPKPTTPDAWATALNAQVQNSSIPFFPVPVSAIHGILLLSPTADWLRIEARAAQNFSSGFPTNAIASDAPIAAARLALTLSTSKVESIDPESWNGFMTQIGVLLGVGDVSAASATAIQNLAVYTQPQWIPALTAGDIQTAEAQP